MARVLGLDLGSHSLKAVVLETSMRGSLVKVFRRVPVPTEGERLQRLSAALAQLVAGEPLLADSVVVALPGTAFATHALTLPFSEPKKIDATLGFELEGQLPFDLTEATFDYHVSTTDPAGTALLVGVVKNEELSTLLSTLRDAKLDPRIVSHPGLAFQSLLGALPMSQPPVHGEDAVAFVDVGHERVTVAIGRPGGAIEAARVFAGGGLALTKALAQEFAIDLAQAQTWKETHGAVGAEAVGPEAERAAGVFLRAFHPSLREIKTTLKAYTARTRRQVGALWLCGGTAELRGLPEWIQGEVGVPTRRLELPAESREAMAGAPTTDAAQAYSLALRGAATGAKAPHFNLRKGEYTFKSDFDFARDKMGQIAAFAVILFILLIASGVVRNTVLERREKQVDGVLCDVTQRVLGKCEKNFDVALNLLKGQNSPAAGVPLHSATSLLAEVTQRMPAEASVTIDQIVVDLDRISLRCETDTSKHIEDVVSALQSYKCFKDVKEGRVEKSKDGSKVSFRIDIQVECPSDAAPQG